MYLDETQLKRFIIGSGLVSTKDITDAEGEAVLKKTSLGEILVNNGKLSQDDLRRMQARASGISFVNLKLQDVDFEALRLIPEPISRKHNIVAFKKTLEGLEVAMLDIGDRRAIDFIESKLGMKILSRLTDVDSMKSALLKYQKNLKTEFADIVKKEASTTRTIDTLLKHAMVQNAADIHIENQEKDLLVRYRIGGVLHDAMVLPKSSWAPLSARIKGLAGLKIDENRFPQDGRFRAEMSGEKISFRLSTLPTYFGEKMVISLLKDNPSGLTLEQVGFHGDSLERIHGALKAHSGLILVAGPRSSGLSTTLYTLLDILNTPKISIATVEDPVEYQIPRVSQVQVRPDIGLSFAQGLRSVIRQDSDVIMVGELEDAEVASLATNAVLSGRLVLSAIPSKSAAHAVARLADLKIEPLLATSTLSLVIGQRIVRKLSHTKDRKPLSRAELGALGKVVDLDRMLTLLRTERVIGPKDGWGEVLFGSPAVSSLSGGYEGFIGIQETLRISPTIQTLIMKGTTPAEIEARAKKEGMVTMLEDGVFKAAQGLTTVEEVLKVLSQ